jgi:hypothetical protein
MNIAVIVLALLATAVPTATPTPVPLYKLTITGTANTPKETFILPTKIAHKITLQCSRCGQ